MDLPKTGKWHLIDPRITGGLLGGDGPPFGTMTVDFQSQTGICKYWTHTGTLSNVKLLGVSRFEAKWAIRGKAGTLTAQLRDDGWLTLDFSGSVSLKTKAKPITIDHTVPKKLAILTCCTNPGWVGGPGHTALIGDRMVYSFENTKGYFDGSMSGWLVMYVTDYLDKPENKARPIVIQELDMGIVDPKPVMEYIHQSMKDDDDYAGSGVCSQKASSALEKGIKDGFNPKGFDTPYKVCKLARRRNLAIRTYLIWDKAQSKPKDVAGMEKKIRDDYDSVSAGSPPDVRNW